MIASIHRWFSAMIRRSPSTYPKSPNPLSQYGTSSHPFLPRRWGSVQALPSNLHQVDTSGSRPVMPSADSCNCRSNHPWGLMAPIGSWTAGLAASGSRLPGYSGVRASAGNRSTTAAAVAVAGPSAAVATAGPIANNPPNSTRVRRVSICCSSPPEGRPHAGRQFTRRSPGRPSVEPDAGVAGPRHTIRRLI